MPVRRERNGRFASSGRAETSDVDLGGALVGGTSSATPSTNSPYYDPATRTYARMSDDEQRDWQRRARARLDEIPKTHAAALRRHAGDNFRHMNAHLRGLPGARPVSERGIATMNRAIAAAGTSDERTVFRGIRLPRPAGDASDESVAREHFEVGQIVRDPAFVSTSANPQCALNMSGAWYPNEVSAGVILEIRTRCGTDVPNDDFWEEAETVLPRNLPMRVEQICTDRRFTSEGGLRTYPAVVVRLVVEDED